MIELGIIFVKTIILLLGGGITYTAYKAYRNNGDQSLGLLSVGFGTVTLGAFLGGVANQIFSVSLAMGVFIDSLLVAVGFAIIMYSLYLER